MPFLLLQALFRPVLLLQVPVPALPWWWPIAAIFGAAGCSLFTTYLMLRINRRYSKTDKQLDAEHAVTVAKAAEEAAFRELVRQKGEQFLRVVGLQNAALRQAEQSRLLQSQARDNDMAYVTEILREGTTVQKQMTGILANIDHLGKGQDQMRQELGRLNETIGKMNDHIIDLSGRYAHRP